MLRSIARGVATFGFIGHLPLAPGTWGSAAALALWLLWRPGGISFAVALIAILLVGTWAADRAESIYGHDSHRVVIDEVAGAWIAVAGFAPAIAPAAAGFVLFRLFDIVKPPPIYQIQALRGGWGVMMDDVLAGIAANALLRIGLLVFPGLAGRFA